jgi:MtN3 and saliva related transmembrane protein
MDIVTLIGSTAATLTTAAFVPQVVKAHQTKETKDLSLLMYVLTAGGLILWTVYGVFLASLPIILANIVTLTLCSYLLYLKVKHG